MQERLLEIATDNILKFTSQVENIYKNASQKMDALTRICDLLQEKGPSSFAFQTAFRRFQLSLTAIKRFCYINTLLKLG